MPQVLDEAAEAGSEFETRDEKFISEDRREADERHSQRVMVEQRDADERCGEQNEINRDTEQQRNFFRTGASRSERGRSGASHCAQHGDFHCE